MEFELGTAILAGLAATAVMTGVLYMGFIIGMRMDMPMMLGTMLLPRGPAAWLLGLMMHFMMGAIFFIIYALLFDLLAIESSLAAWGAVFGLAHGTVAGMAMGMMNAMHPRMEASPGHGGVGALQAPGFFGLRVSAMAPAAILMLHAVYGAVGGAIYAA
jgi:hypothetical protein